MTTFTALGDSITLGLGDPLPSGEWRGWAVFLAEGLPAGQLHNLATTGAQAADVERSQLPRALELRPDVASVVVGINDTLRRGFDPVRVHDALGHVVGSLSAAGAVVLTMRLPDPGRMLGMPTALARPLAGRIRDLNQIMDQLAAQFGTLHFDAAEDSQVYERCMWSVDRLHPSERGHRHIACRFHDQLAAQGHPVGPRPGTEPTSPPPTRRDELTWMATKGAKWVLRRCTDLLPYLVAMAVREYFRRPGPEPPAGPALPVPSAGGQEPERAGH